MAKKCLRDFLKISVAAAALLSGIPSKNIKTGPKSILSKDSLYLLINITALTYFYLWSIAAFQPLSIFPTASQVIYIRISKTYSTLSFL